MRFGADWWRSYRDQGGATSDPHSSESLRAMRSGIDKILRDVQARPYSLKNVPIEALHAIWNGLCAHIHSVLANGKVLSCPSSNTVHGTQSSHIWGIWSCIRAPALCSLLVPLSSFADGRLCPHKALLAEWGWGDVPKGSTTSFPLQVTHHHARCSGVLPKLFSSS